MSNPKLETIADLLRQSSELATVIENRAFELQSLHLRILKAVLELEKGDYEK